MIVVHVINKISRGFPGYYRLYKLVQNFGNQVSFKYLCFSTLTMDKLLESLIAKAKLECEEAHRQLLFAFNGLFLTS